MPNKKPRGLPVSKDALKQHRANNIKNRAKTVIPQPLLSFCGGGDFLLASFQPMHQLP